MVQGTVKYYRWPSQNFGDTLTPIILKHFIKQDIELAKREDPGKLLAVGSILRCIKENDVVWGSGTQNRTIIIVPKGVKFLAIRGPISKHYLKGKVPEIYGDPGILLPLIYNPKIEKTHEVGYVPHYIDKIECRIRHDTALKNPKVKLIDIMAPWKTVIDEMISCKKIISSSLHGIVVAEAYGIPAVWTKYTNNIRGREMKYQDYFLGTGRGTQKYNKQIPPIKDLEKRQQILINALQNYYGKN